MVNGEPNARAVHFFLEGDDPQLLPLVGDGLLPPDMDGNRRPKTDSAPIVGTQDDSADYGATFDAINIWELSIKWRAPDSFHRLAAQLETAPFDSIYPCAPDRPRLPARARNREPCTVSRHSVIPAAADVAACLSEFRQVRALVTNQSVEATPGVAGARWYEIRREVGSTASSSRERTLRVMASIAGWAASPWTKRGTWLSAIA